jgi:hypothetical protein
MKRLCFAFTCVVLLDVAVGLAAPPSTEPPEIPIGADAFTHCDLIGTTSIAMNAYS